MVPTLKPEIFPHPGVQPTPANDNSLHGKRAPNNPGNGKPGVKDPGNGKPAVNNAGNGNTIDNNVRRGKTTNDNRDSYADAMQRYRHERHDCDWWKQHYIVIVLVGGGYYYRDADIGIRPGDTIPIMSGTITTDRFTPMAICCRTR